jgi:predicted HTH domain antitoxin
MHTHALNTALTLYRSGTLSLTQAAHRAGCSEREMARALGRHGITIRESFPSHAALETPSASAD